MLKKRIIPKLLIKNKSFGRVSRPILVTSKKFDRIVDVGDAVSQAKIYEAQLADELIVLNIESIPIQQDSILLELIERLATETFMPLAVGGGVKTIDDFTVLLGRGADKVCINTEAIQSLSLISQAAERFGSQCVVISIDFRYDHERKKEIVFSHGGTKNTGLDVIEWAKQAVNSGAGEIILTDADRDGTGVGLNLSVGRAVVHAAKIPVILSGGCGLASHFVEGFLETKVEGISAGTFFSLRDQNPMQTRAHVASAGIPIRAET